MYLFLDIDGVLNTEEEWSYSYLLNSRCLDNLEAALDGLPGIEIILITSWRRGFTSRRHKRNLPHIQTLESELDKRSLSIAGTINKAESRMKAIEEFLRKHPGNYIILDDDESEYNESEYGDEFNYKKGREDY